MKKIMTLIAAVLSMAIIAPGHAEDKAPKELSEREHEKLSKEAYKILEGINEATKKKLTEYLNNSSDEDLKKIKGIKDPDVVEIKARRPWGSPERVIYNEKLGRKALKDMAEFAKDKSFVVADEEKKEEDGKDKKREKKDKDAKSENSEKK
jgi:hypothetical protein